MSRQRHWAVDLIGRPWSAIGEGPDSFNCWTFVRFVQKKIFGRDLSIIPVPGDNLLQVVRTFRDHPERKGLSEVAAPDEGDCVLLRQARYPVHVGVWLEVDGGGVLHCTEGPGVVFQPLSVLPVHGWQVEGFYRFGDGRFRERQS
ncbi:MAG: hypothetical protein HQL72_02245 [Magnetococcales bacterium]|nr:hypothetical protein [Magnetococcales bacterium]